MPAEKRRRWFDSPANAAKVVLSKDYVYTWHIWQHWCNVSTYRLQLSSFFGVDLCHFSEGQPMQIMAKNSKVGVGRMRVCVSAAHLAWPVLRTHPRNGGAGPLAAACLASSSA
jgi:hypothetical protein